MKKLVVAVLLTFALVAGIASEAAAQWGWRRPRVYAVVPPPVYMPPPRPVCPVVCQRFWHCNVYGWCHWRRRCAPTCY